MTRKQYSSGEIIHKLILTEVAEGKTGRVGAQRANGTIELAYRHYFCTTYFASPPRGL